MKEGLYNVFGMHIALTLKNGDYLGGRGLAS